MASKFKKGDKLIICDTFGNVDLHNVECEFISGDGGSTNQVYIPSRAEHYIVYDMHLRYKDEEATEFRVGELVQIIGDGPVSKVGDKCEILSFPEKRKSHVRVRHLRTQRSFTIPKARIGKIKETPDTPTRNPRLPWVGDTITTITGVHPNYKAGILGRVEATSKDDTRCLVQFSPSDLGEKGQPTTNKGLWWVANSNLIIKCKVRRPPTVFVVGDKIITTRGDSGYYTSGSIGVVTDRSSRTHYSVEFSKADQINTGNVYWAGGVEKATWAVPAIIMETYEESPPAVPF